MERSLSRVDPASRREARGFASERATTLAYAIGVAGTTPGVQPRSERVGGARLVRVERGLRAGTGVLRRLVALGPGVT